MRRSQRTIEARSAGEPTAEAASVEFELTVRKLADDLAYGADASRFVGSGIDFAQSRRYVAGDAVRSIDWRLTARTGRVHVKEYEASKRAPVVLLVDASASMEIGAARPTKREVAAWIAGALALVALRRLSPVGVVGCGEREMRLAPSLSRSATRRWMEALRTAPSAGRTRLAERVREAGAMATRMTVFVVLSDLHDPGGVEAIQGIAQRHDCMVIQPRDRAEGGRLRAGFVRAQEAETGRAFLAGGRTRWFEDGDAPGARLADSGVDHVLLETDRPIAPALGRFLLARGGLWRNTR